MDAWTDRTIRDRHDRHVRRARLSVSAGASQHRLAFTVEEALRLASLPGENEGRSYYFRRLRITGLPSSGDRAVWLDKFQRALTSEAMQAVHGGDPCAGFAQAVFFRSEQEPLEILLHRLLARQPIPEWFWPMVTAEPGADRSGAIPPTIVEVVEKLRRQPASWVAVAAALYAVPGFDVVCLLNAVMTSVAQSWVQEMEGQGPFPPHMAADIPRPAQTAIQRALRVFGARNAGTLWLTALAVLLDSPSELAAGSAVWRARGALQRMAFEKESKVGEVESVATPARPVATSPEVSSEGIAATSSPAPPSSSDSPITPTPPDSLRATAALDAVVPPAGSLGNIQFAAAGPASTSPESETLPAPLPWYCFGVPTTAAGLFFLLNALRRIGMPQALAAGLTWVD